MTQKIPCPECGELNYTTSPACWKCDAPMKPRPAPPAAEPAPEASALPEEPPVAAEPVALPETPQPGPVVPPAPMVPPPTADQPEPLGPVEPPAPPLTEPVTPNPEDRAPEPAAVAAVADPSSILHPPSSAAPKPAELEAAALKDKDFVTPPVDVEETPKSAGEWVAYGLAAVGASGQAFRQALDDYDVRRGKKSGGMSSYGCVIGMVISAIGIVLIVTVVMILARGRGG